ncbi:hypothetical protein J4E08_22680 [Sagittula sp. NFXS13]|uniref:hypothetical protein n=1 Tax=Sagittula sp. NFXS13 TaxID=2819095 RepID=UPI0032DFC16C
MRTRLDFLALAICVAAPINAQEQLRFNVEDLNCVHENLEAYLKAAKSDPLTIVVAACPERDVRAALKKLQQNNMFRREPSVPDAAPTQIAALNAAEWRCLVRRAETATEPFVEVTRGAICE